MRYLLVCLIVLLISCRNERELQLPQIDKAEITEIQDVSAAYLFYDETQPDSVLLNRKNLISTTNWLVNVDKRLTLKQAIPHIKFLQSKKKSSSHKNKKAKNYFTCHDLSKNNLGFLEFTDTEFSAIWNDSLIIRNSFPKIPNLILEFDTKNTVKLFDLFGHNLTNRETISRKRADEIDQIQSIIKSYSRAILKFNNQLSFQEYISIKAMISQLDLENIEISKSEFIID